MSFRTDITPKWTVASAPVKRSTKVNLILAFSQWASGIKTTNENDQAIKMHTQQSNIIIFQKNILKLKYA